MTASVQREPSTISARVNASCSPIPAENTSASQGGDERPQLPLDAIDEERDRCARALVHASAQSGELRDRLAGLEEARTATRQEIALSIRIAAAGRELAEARGCYMAKRTERRQVETLIEAAESEERLLDSRRNQQALDDGYRSSGHRTRS